jgi:hypothetical protein
MIILIWVLEKYGVKGGMHLLSLGWDPVVGVCEHSDEGFIKLGNILASLVSMNL